MFLYYMGSKNIKNRPKEKSVNEKSYINFLNEFGYNKYQNSFFIPNEIFEDLLSTKIKPVHIAFSYSYYYLISWLYRYGKYGELSISSSTLKEKLGYNKNNKTLDYIIKEGGVLDELGYTKSTKNFSVGVNGKYSDNAPKFLLARDLLQHERGSLYKRINRNFKAKYPIKHIHRDKEDFKEKMLTGVFFDISNTHQIDFEVFSFCMSNESIGTIGFYIYCFLKNKSQIFQGAYQVSYEGLSVETGIPYSTLSKYLDALRGYGMVIGVQNQDYYVEGLSDKDREANHYEVNSSVNEFYFIKKDYMKIQGINLEQYKRMTQKNEGEWEG